MVRPDYMSLETRQPVVWIVNEGGHNYEPAKKFGRLMPLTTGNINQFNLDRLMVSIAPKLQSAHQDDYVAISGAPIVNALVISMWLTRFPKINILQWKPREEIYVLIPLFRDAVVRMSTQDMERTA